MRGKLSFLSLLFLLLSREAQLYPGGQDYIVDSNKSKGRPEQQYHCSPLIFCSDCSRFHNTEKWFEHHFFPIKVKSTVTSINIVCRSVPLPLHFQKYIRARVVPNIQRWIRRLWTLLSLRLIALIEIVTILRQITGHLRYVSPKDVTAMGHEKYNETTISVCFLLFFF